MKIRTKDHAIYYELDGKVGAPVVVLSHALAATSAMWEAQVSALEKSYRVLSYDIRGHGQSGSPTGSFCLDQLADDAQLLLDALELGQVHWVGSCLGGIIGQVLALRPSNRIASLVLADTMAILTEETHCGFSERIRSATERGLEAVQQPILQEWFTDGYREREPQQLESSGRQILAGSVVGFAGCCQAILGLDHLASLRELDLPTLVVVGADDAVSPISAALAMHERIAGSRLEIIHSAAHLATVEQAPRFNEILLEFLR